ncbi:hypothetical protein F4808DRAFT_435968 [Astrocystis sublimbata]|nr:hypothetical protein F4808DRAFT_435968 [Astrocystis sublimbata]
MLGSSPKRVVAACLGLPVLGSSLNFNIILPTRTVCYRDARDNVSVSAGSESPWPLLSRPEQPTVELSLVKTHAKSSFASFTSDSA